MSYRVHTSASEGPDFRGHQPSNSKSSSEFVGAVLSAIYRSIRTHIMKSKVELFSCRGKNCSNQRVLSSLLNPEQSTVS